MILGIGTDILRIERMADAYARRGDALARRLLHDRELHQWQAHARPVRWLAKRFAAKEALLKALGTGLRAGIRWRDLAVLNDGLGRPEVLLEGAAARRLRELGASAASVSISDEDDYVVAFALIQSGG